MHTYEADKGTVFNYNSDFSGVVSIQSEVDDNGNLSVFAEDLIDFIAYCFVLQQRVSRLEDASSEWLLR